MRERLSRQKFEGQRARSLSLLPNNQVEHRAHHDDFAQEKLCENAKYYFVMDRPSARIPDVPLQVTDCVDVARTVRESVRVLESCEHAN
jgi:hypothetical protein